MRTSTKTVAILAIAILSLGAVGLALGDSDDDDHERHEKGDGWLKSRPDVAPVVNATYSEECGSCHMAYQPGLLPGDAWTQIMSPAGLSDHYGDDASLADDVRADITAFLLSNSADQAERSRSRAFAVSANTSALGQGTALPRITETRYFLHEHDEIPARLVTGNPEVGSFSQCNSCHRGAAEGVYNEKQVSIPGHGRWDD
ncbi:diheme cytochrome c [Thiocapsa bogorovii]|uniref:diheme cytochrome c n=1 Tax=Thiocapsa bogorovii TaxID=521689 RepID=UPI001E5AB8A8|nr:diheme cytochrome c [Thiocapsa bogorovii]UHD14254.1 diheme cytochrome c [Thiocapsa bogorovii]